MSDEKKWYDYLDVTNDIKLGGDKLLGTTEEERKRALALQAGEGGRMSGGRRPWQHIVNEVGSRGLSLGADLAAGAAVEGVSKGAKAIKYGAKEVTPKAVKSASRLSKINKSIKAAEAAKKEIKNGAKEFASKVDYSKLPKNTGYKELDEISDLIENGDVAIANKRLMNIIEDLSSAKYNIDNPNAHFPAWAEREWDSKEFEKAKELKKFVNNMSSYNEVEDLLSGLSKEGQAQAKDALDTGAGWETIRYIFKDEGKPIVDRLTFEEKVGKDKISSIANASYEKIAKDAKAPRDVNLNLLHKNEYEDFSDFLAKEFENPNYDEKKIMFDLKKSLIDKAYNKAIKEGKTFEDFSKDLADNMHSIIKSSQPEFKSLDTIEKQVAEVRGAQRLFRKGELDDIQKSINSLEDQAIAYNNLITFDNEVKRIGKNEHLDRAFEIERKRLEDALNAAMGKDEKFFKDIEMLDAKLNALGKEKKKAVLQFMKDNGLSLIAGAIETRVAPTLENAVKNGGKDVKNYLTDKTPKMSAAYIKPDVDPISSRAQDFVLDLLDINPSDPADYDMDSVDEMINILIKEGQIHRDSKYLSDSDKIKLLKKAGKNELARSKLKDYIDSHNYLNGKQIYKEK